MLKYLYSMVGIIALIGYLPQIYKLWQTSTGHEAFSLTSWLLWTSTWLISFLYAWIELGDKQFIFVASINLFCYLTIVMLIIQKRLFARR